LALQSKPLLINNYHITHDPKVILRNTHPIWSKWVAQNKSPFRVTHV